MLFPNIVMQSCLLFHLARHSLSFIRVPLSSMVINAVSDIALISTLYSWSSTILALAEQSTQLQECTSLRARSLLPPGLNNETQSHANYIITSLPTV